MATSKANQKTPKQVLEKKDNDKAIYFFAGALVILYYLFSFKSNGYYQHDEIMHYNNMLDFWRDPKVILGNSAKPGYKLIYVLPALLGEGFLKFFNCAFAALGCVLVYKTAKLFNSRFTLLSFFLLALQPYWIQLAFRNYADSFSGVLLILGIYLHYKGKFPLTALIISFLSTIRQEFTILTAFYGIWLLWNKKFLPLVLCGVFPLLYDFFGYLATGDPLYLINETLKGSAQTASEWPRQGFDHYFKLAAVIWSSVAVTLLFLYFVTAILKKTKLFDKEKYLKDYPNLKGYMSPAFIVIPFIVYFLIHCIFNFQAKAIGASTGGNLRYMVAVAPCVALLGALALDRLWYFKKLTLIIASLLVLIVLAAVYQSYEHNNVLLQAERNWGALFITLATSLAVLLIKKPSTLTYTLIFFILIFDLSSIKPFKLTEEDKTIQRAAGVQIIKNAAKENKVYTNHVLFSYFLHKINVRCTPHTLDSTTLVNVEKGSIVIWDSHYSYRPNLNPKSVKLDYFNQHADEFAFQQNFISSDQRFQASVFEKIK